MKRATGVFRPRAYNQGGLAIGLTIVKQIYLYLLLIVSVTCAHAADVLYVDDKLMVTLRAGQGNQYRILRNLESGTRLEVLAIDGDYVQVRDPKGTEGWVRMQFLTDQPVARDRLAAAEKKLVALETEKQRLREQLTDVQSERNAMRETTTQRENEYRELQSELAELRQASADPIRLRDENRAINERLSSLTDENRMLRETNKNLRGDVYRQWFLTGAGVLGVGILLGLFIPKIKRHRSGWDDLR